MSSTDNRATPALRPLVLIVDDEPMVREVVASYLERDDFRVATAGDGDKALAFLQDRSPDLVVLDLMLPGVGGLEILEHIRGSEGPAVIVLTARGHEADRILGLELGADDYVVKPFSPRELAARVKSVLRRANPPPPQATMESTDLVIDPTRREVTVRGEVVDLTPREFDLLAFLASSPGQVFSRSQLLEHVWDSSPQWQDSATVTVHVRRIRYKIESDPTEPRWIQTVWGLGYRFDP
jgi:DNA-binding response OmpR family regulator